MELARHPRFYTSRPASSGWSERTELIWHPEEVETHFEPPRNAFCYFRKTFELPARPVRAVLRMFADTRYKLYVNGEYVARGPCRSDPRRQYYDELDIAGLLREGRNVIAVLAVHYGYGTGQSVNRIPALAAEGCFDWAGGERFRIHSDSSWKCRRADAYSREAPRINGCQGPVEIFDAALEPHGWTDVGYDDGESGGWVGAKGRSPRLSPFWNWARRDIPLVEEAECEARRIVNTGRLTEAARPIGELHKQLKDEERGMRLTGAVSAAARDFAAPAVPAGEASVVTFDLGTMEAGYLQLDVTGSRGDVLDVVYAEELWEGKALIDLSNNRPIDRFVLAEGRNRLETAFAWRACRYIQIRVRNRRGPVIFHKVGLRTRRYPLEKTASLQCGDERLAGIWDISARTLRLCMQDGFLDSSSREQQQWMGDGRWQAVINCYYSGDPRLHRKLLEQIGQSQDWTGMTKARHPDGHHNYPPIPSFCLAWICSFSDYRTYTGDGELVRAWWPNIVQALRWFSAFENEAGLLEDVPYWSFIDWAEGPEGPVMDDQRGGVVTALNLQYLEALCAAAEFARELNDREAECVYADKIAKLRLGIANGLWDERKGAYADCRVNGVLSDSVSEPVNALAVLHLHRSEDERARAIFRNVFAKDAPIRATRGSPYFMLTIGRALIKLGRAERALELIRERYGAFLDAGSHTTWERWTLFHKQRDGRVRFSSASHAWGAGPIAFVFEGIFGLRPLEAGFRRFSLDPDPCGLEDIGASLPVAAGEVRMALRRIDARRWRLELDVPEGFEAVVRGRTLGAGTHNAIVEGRNGGTGE